MLFYGSLDEIPADFGPSVVTIGKFDGVHAGHRRIVEELRAIAEQQALVSTVVTFDRNPLSLLRPESCPISLSSNAQKREVLSTVGVDVTVMVPFTLEFSRLDPEAFVRSVLVDALHATVVLVGPNFRFGVDGRGSVDTLRELGATFGFEVRVIEPLKVEGDRWVSSTLIRELLSAGRVVDAARLLGRLPSVRGVVVRGEQRGRELGYPTANLSPDLEGFIPADGVYAGLLTVDGHQLPAAVSVGNNPTFDGVPEKQVEAHVLDATLDLYDQTVELAFVDYVRPMAKFADVAELVDQIARDEVRVREILGKETP